MAVILKTEAGVKLIYTLPKMLFLTILIASVSPITFGMYYSCLPQICTHFVNHPIFQPQLAFITYMVGFLMFQIIYGPLSDFYGRKPIILAGMIVFVIGSSLNLLSESLFFFVFSRYFQGVGAAYSNPLSRALQKDIFNDKQYFVFGSYVAMGLSLTAMCSPMIGSFVQKLNSGNYKANVIFVALYVLFAFIITLKFFPETNLNRNSAKISLTKLYQEYVTIIRNWQFLSLSVFGGLIYGAEISFYTLAPLILKNEYMASSMEYGVYILIISSGFFIGSFLSSQINKYNHFLHSPTLGIILLSLLGVIMLVHLTVYQISLLFFQLYFWIMMFSIGLISSNVSQGAIFVFRDKIGAAASLFCSFQFLIGCLSITICYFLGIVRLKSIIYFLSSIYILLIFCLVISKILERKYRRKSNNILYSTPLTKAVQKISSKAGLGI